MYMYNNNNNNNNYDCTVYVITIQYTKRREEDGSIL